MKFPGVTATVSLLLTVLPTVGGAPTSTNGNAAANPNLRGSPELVGLLPGQKENSKTGSYLDFESVENPQPIRGSKGGDDPGPRDYSYERINSDKYAPPGTDNGATINAQWPMGLSHNRLGLDKSGWARQQNTDVLPDAKEMAGVDMRLEPAAYRELHWHVAAEWSLVLNGSCRIQAINEDGETFVDDVQAGDVWYFPPGVPHSIQALDDGVEFLLVFDQGSFNEDNTFLASEVFMHNPREVMAKNLGVPVSAFDNIPDKELYIFNGTPAPKQIEDQNVTTGAGIIPQSRSYSYHFSQQPAHEVAGGSVKIVDPLTFPIASNFSAAIVTVNPGGMREIHWHPSSDEWTFFIKGQGRGTLFTAPSDATTFDYRAGDVAYFPKSNSHYIENTGDEDLVFVEVLQAPKFTDVALGQWIASTPRQIVKDTLNLSDDTLSRISTEKQYVVAGEPKSSQP
ncbi:Oxalate decarboxylase OxdC [Penicillium diatomitis]|uniref:Oxalate decarboxylase OxdC n=1 Tax=Penicillium diatomitis TaxID=2819901 RepID=A0A9W9WTR0_9EURO|nr:Oxalate decarboxylase OxdC [Penicillium diatomitis]KAJ5475186.1 Oxalate decarboxylase OxdC [Penicillium diatomitis]